MANQPNSAGDARPENSFSRFEKRQAEKFKNFEQHQAESWARQSRSASDAMGGVRRPKPGNR